MTHCSASLKSSGISPTFLISLRWRCRKSEYGSVTFSVVDLSERSSSDEGPHCRHGKLVRQMKIVGEFTSRRHKCAQGTTPLSVAVCWADRNIHRIPREVAPTPMPLVLDQGSGPLQDLNINRSSTWQFSPPISPFFAELNSSRTLHTSTSCRRGERLPYRPFISLGKREGEDAWLRRICSRHASAACVAL